MAQVQKLFPLLQLLADGRFHSGEAIGEVLGVSRAAVWKKLQQLSDLGLQVESVKGRGYCLAEPICLFDEENLQQFAKAQGLPLVHILPEVDSSNAYLLRLLAEEKVAANTVAVAEWQSAGRGRRGRQWQSPFAKNLYFSQLFCFEQGVSQLDGLSLVVGLSVVDALTGLGCECQLKWPNDVLYNNKKLAGILLEMTGDPSGLCYVVAGVGLNVNMKNSGGAIDQAWVSLAQALGEVVDKNKLTTKIMLELQKNIALFKAEGFAAFAQRWHKVDAFLEQQVVLHLGEKQIFATDKGVNEKGELLLDVDGQLQSFNGGEVSLRKL